MLGPGYRTKLVQSWDGGLHAGWGLGLHRRALKMYFQFIVKVAGEITFRFLPPARKNTARVECPDFGIFVYS